MINIAEFAALFHREISSVATLEQIQKDLMAGLDRAGTPYITPAENARDVFIKRARAVHGDRYGYEEVVYVNSVTKIRIACPKHGVFEQAASSHLNGRGCAKCAGKHSPTTEEFIAKARAVHGGRYGYEGVVYVGAMGKIRITCPEHGVFEQAAGAHLSGSGCQRCAGRHQHSTEEFIAKAKKVHGDRYGYEEVVYVTMKDKVRITCPEHGVFEPTAGNFLRGSGCPTCAGRNKSTAEEFIVKAREVHGDRYNYDEVVYVNAHAKVRIICPEHGVFEQKPNSHLSGSGCAKCTGRNKTTEEFVAQARAVHGDRYMYDEVAYVRGNLKVLITCPEHGVFEQAAKGHLTGKGCPRCATRNATTEEFITKVKKTHGDRYGYDEVVYVNSTTKVRITCPEHGVFEQAPSEHSRGYGCPKCGKAKAAAAAARRAKSSPA
jgi:hypothetical protein